MTQGVIKSEKMQGPATEYTGSINKLLTTKAQTNEE